MRGRPISADASFVDNVTVPCGDKRTDRGVAHRTQVKSAVAPTATTFDITTSWYASPEPDIFEVCAEDDRLAIGLWGNNFIPESGHQTPEDNRRPKLDIAASRWPTASAVSIDHLDCSTFVSAVIVLSERSSRHCQRPRFLIAVGNVFDLFFLQ